MGTGRLITSLRPYQGAHPLTYPYLSEFVSGIVAGRVEIKKIPALPQIKMRTKKNEQAVVDKRRRAAERKKREEEQRMGGIRDETAGAFGGDSKAERKAKRDELRAEHYKKNNVRERTPEELAEMERNRRKRMEEEAAKWNVMEEDAPPLGDEVTDDVTSDMFEDMDEDIVDIDEVDEDADEDGFVDLDDFDEEENDDIDLD